MKTTVWDNIYNDFLEGGKAWASINDELHPEFLSLIENSTFPHKNALDIGCGTGKYLKYLLDAGFNVTGIDSSETAIKMTGELLHDQGSFIVADMYEYEYTVNTYDLIISHCTLHHGRKGKVISVLMQIYQALLPDGKTFISLPSNEGKKHWIMMGEHETLDDGTCIPLTGPEKGLPHSFYSRAEVEQLFASYRNREISFNECDSRWIITAQK